MNYEEFMEIAESNKEIISSFANTFISTSGAQSCLVLSHSQHDIFNNLVAAKVDRFEGKGIPFPASGSWDIVFGDFPFSVSGGLFGEDFDKNSSYSTNATIKALNFLSENGYGVFTAEPLLLTTTSNRSIKNFLEPLGYCIVAIFNVPAHFLRSTAFRPILIVIRKRCIEKQFVAEIESAQQASNLVHSFFDKKDSHTLTNGIFVDSSDFKGFYKWKIQQQIAAIESEYKSFTTKKISEIAIEVNLAKTGESHHAKINSIYIPKVGNQTVIADLTKAKIKHQNYCQVVLRQDMVDAEYLAAFFESKLGRLILESLSTAGVISHINKVDILECEIAIPLLKQQREIVDSIRKLGLIKQKISSFEADLAVNPISSNYALNQIDSMLTVVGELADADKVKSTIRNGESKITEFKQTLSLDVAKQTKESYIELAAIKTIAGFLNTDGGTLLIGVNDDGRITGIEKEIELFYKNKDKFLLQFKNLLKSKIGEQFYPFIDQNIINVDGTNIFCVDCRPSTDAVYVDEKDFYVRTNPATDKLEGRKLVDYIQYHFKN